jgi:hypothetical protein
MITGLPHVGMASQIRNAARGPAVRDPDDLYCTVQVHSAGHIVRNHEGTAGGGWQNKSPNSAPLTGAAAWLSCGPPICRPVVANPS